MLSTTAPAITPAPAAAAARPDYAALRLGRIWDSSEIDAYSVITTSKTTRDSRSYASLDAARAAAHVLAPRNESQAVGVFQHGGAFYLQQLDQVYVAPFPGGDMNAGPLGPLTDVASMSVDPPRAPQWVPYRQGATAQELRLVVDGELEFDAAHRADD